MQSDHKRCLEDNTPVEFTATADGPGRLYSLVVSCKKPLSEEEYALCLISFAEDILENRFSFDDADIVSEMSAQ